MPPCMKRSECTGKNCASRNRASGFVFKWRNALSFERDILSIQNATSEGKGNSGKREHLYGIHWPVWWVRFPGSNPPKQKPSWRNSVTDWYYRYLISRPYGVGWSSYRFIHLRIFGITSDLISRSSLLFLLNEVMKSPECWKRTF